MGRSILRAVLTVLMLLSTGGSIPLAQNSPSIVEVQVVPASVQVPAQGHVDVLVLARNSSGDRFDHVRLSWFGDAGVAVVGVDPSASSLAPYAVLAWTLHISQSGQVPVAGTLYLRLDYTLPKEKGAAPQVTMGTLQIAAREPEPIEQVIEVQTKTAMSSLMEYRPGVIALLLTNLANVPVTVTQILPSGPDFIGFSPATVGSTRFEPHQVRAVSITTAVDGAVRPGKHLLLFEIDFEWTQAKQRRVGSIVETQEVEVGVLGESTILTLLGVPSFLALPGFLALLVVGFLWKRVYPKRDFALQLKDIEFWFWAITLSLFAAPLYQWITWRLGWPSNYLEGYGLTDLWRVWLGSVLLTLCVYLLATGIVWLGRKASSSFRRWYTRLYALSEDDSPVALLRKLGRWKRAVCLPLVKLDLDGLEILAFLLLQDRVQGTAWVGPAIRLSWVGNLAQEQGLRRQIDKQRSLEGDVSELADLLQQGIASGVLQVRWHASSQLKRPRQVKVEQLKGELSPAIIVEQA